MRVKLNELLVVGKWDEDSLEWTCKNGTYMDVC